MWISRDYRGGAAQGRVSGHTGKIAPGKRLLVQQIQTAGVLRDFGQRDEKKYCSRPGPVSGLGIILTALNAFVCVFLTFSVTDDVCDRVVRSGLMQCALDVFDVKLYGSCKADPKILESALDTLVHISNTSAFPDELHCISSPIFPSPAATQTIPNRIRVDRLQTADGWRSGNRTGSTRCTNSATGAPTIACTIVPWPNCVR